MKVTAIISILLCFAFVISLALTGCRKNNDDYFMGSSEYNSLISGIESNKNNLTSSEEDKTPENDDGKDVTPPPVSDKGGDTIENSSKVSTGTSSVGTSSVGSSSVATPSSTPSPSSSSSEESSSSAESSSTPESSSSSEPSSSSNKNISTTLPDGAIDIIV